MSIDGLTETSPTTHLCPPDEQHPGTIGYLLPNQLGRIVDPVSGEDCKEGEEGELWIKGPSASSAQASCHTGIVP